MNQTSILVDSVHQGIPAEIASLLLDNQVNIVRVVGLGAVIAKTNEKKI